MAEIINVAGPCEVIVGTAADFGLETLGFSINGVQIFEDVYMSDVPGDQRGGDEGPPIDIQAFGQVDRVRIEFSKYDPDVEQKVAKRLNLYSGQDPGEPIPVPGTLVFQGDYTYRLLLLAPNFVRNYLATVPRAPIQGNFGSKFSRKVMEFECHNFGENPLWNTTQV